MQITVEVEKDTFCILLSLVEFSNLIKSPLETHHHSDYQLISCIEC